MNRRIGGLALGAGLALAGAAHAEPAQLLLQAGNATQATGYRGVVVYRDARGTEVLRVSHSVEDGRWVDRLTTLTGASRTVVGDAAGLACSAPGRADRTAAVSAAVMPTLSPGTVSALGQHYELRDTGGSHVAGRACRGLALKPRDGFRYGYEICADAATAVPLQVGLTDAGGRSLESLVFTEIQFGGGTAATPVRAARARPALASEAVDPRWSFGVLPPGYAVVARDWVPAQQGLGKVEHVILSDGLSAISVFATAEAPGEAAEGMARLGTVNAYVRRLQGLHLTVMGEAPEAAVRLIGDGLLAATGRAATPVSARR